jgi:hypothetical protein
MRLLFKICEILYRQKSITPANKPYQSNIQIFTYDIVADPGFNTANYE